MEMHAFVCKRAVILSQPHPMSEFAAQQDSDAESANFAILDDRNDYANIDWKLRKQYWH